MLAIHHMILTRNRHFHHSTSTSTLSFELTHVSYLTILDNHQRTRKGIALFSDTTQVDMHRRTHTYLAILVVAFNILLRHCDCVSCPPGTFTRKSKCESCAPGSYSETQNVTSCTLCPEGTFYPFRGATTYSNCLPCRTGTFLPRRGARMESACKLCPSSTFSQSGASQCVTCSPGSGIDTFSGNECNQCDPGTYNDGTMKFCKRCPSGTQADREFGATKCTTCEPGTFRDMRYISRIDRWKCERCPENSFTDKTGTQQCSLCPPGTIAERGATECSPCPKNTFRAKLRRTMCLPCPEGTVSEPGSAECRHKKKGCPFNTFEDRMGACRACAPGERQDPKKRDCVPCADDEASPGGAVMKCTQCTGNTIPAPDHNVFERSECWCKLGYTRAADGSCVPCKAGTYGTLRPAGALWDNYYRYFYKRTPYCTECELGSTSSEGATECTLCPPMTVAAGNFIGPKFCVSCPKGTRPDSVAEFSFDGPSVDNFASQCLTKRFSCRRGEIRDENENCGAPPDKCPWPQRRTYYGACRACESYQYWNTTQMECDSCPSGTTNEESREHTRTSCVLCQLNANFVNGKCECRDGFVKIGKRCKRCSPPLVYKEGKCVPCASGTSRKNGATMSCGGVCRGEFYLPKGAKTCLPCPPGYKSMFDVVGNKLNKCAPVDMYSKKGKFFGH